MLFAILWTCPQNPQIGIALENWHFAGKRRLEKNSDGFAKFLSFTRNIRTSLQFE
jgi:hypothetical protein